MDLEKAIFSISSKEDFDNIALQVFHYQFQHCAVYREFCEALKRTNPSTISEIPFLPIDFFKSKKIISDAFASETIIFKSSGTTQQIRSSHYVASTKLYEHSFLKTYKNYIGNPENQIIVALLPNYLEQGNSSLVYMVDHLIRESKNPVSGFYLNQVDAVLQAYEQSKIENKKFILFGVSYALLDLAATNIRIPEALVIETGGMKGKRKEISKEELHALLKDSFEVDFIHSEYGMTELLSQAYSDKDGLFETPNWMKILIRDINDPFSYVHNGKTGGINVIDLANLYSCSFIATQDLGRIEHDRLRLMGRFDNADIRGCNLLVD